MTMNMEDIINRERETTAKFHAVVAQSWRRIGEGRLLHSPLVYSAFEYRLAIERIAFELYWLMKREHLLPKGGFSKEELRKIQSFSSLVSKICQDSGSKLKLYRILSFNRVFSQIFTQLPQTLSIPDIGKLQNYWERLSEYCHRQLEPSKTWESSQWIKKGYSRLNEVESYIWQICVSERFGWLQEGSLPNELLKEKDKYMRGELNESQLKRRMELIKPVLELKKGIFSFINKAPNKKGPHH